MDPINGEFETDDTGWVAYNFAATARTTEQAKNGTASLSVDASDSNMGVRYDVTGIAAGSICVARAWLLIDVGESIVCSVNSPVGSQVATTTLPGTGSWQQTSLSFTAGATGVARLFFLSPVGALDYLFYIDGVELEELPWPTSFPASVLF